MSETLPIVPTGDLRLDELLANGAIKPVQVYGEGKKLCLDVFAAAAYVGCAKGTIYRAEFREKFQAVPNPSRSNNRLGYTRTYPLSELCDLSRRRRQLIIDDWKTGKYQTVTDLARVHHVDRTTASKILKAAGLTA